MRRTTNDPHDDDLHLRQTQGEHSRIATRAKKEYLKPSQWSAFVVRAPAPRRRCLSSLHAGSMGLRSGQ